jgi:hypothetical protein
MKRFLIAFIASMIFATGVAQADRISDLQDSIDQLQDDMIDQEVIRMIRDRNISNATSGLGNANFAIDYKELAKISGSGFDGTAGLKKKSIKKLNSTMFSAIGVIHWSKPLRSPEFKKAYVWHLIAEVFDCQTKNVITVGALFLDSRLKIVDKVDFPKEYLIPVPYEKNTEIVQIWSDYVCKTYYVAKP